MDAQPKVEHEPTGLRLGSLFGIPILLSPGWLLISAWLLIVYAASLDRVDPTLGAGRFAVALAFPLLFGLSVLLHELGHAAVGVACRMNPVRIELDGWGGNTDFGGDAPTPLRAFLIAAAGPASSGAVGVLAMAGAAAAAPGALGHFVLIQLALGNLVLAAFNLLPGLPLDGGHMLRALLWRLTDDARCATTWSAFSGLLLAATVVIVPVGLLLNGGERPSLFIVAVLILLAAPLATGAWSVLTSEDSEPTGGSANALHWAVPVVDCPAAEPVQGRCG